MIKEEQIILEENSIETMPLLALRGLCVFPQMVIHFDVGRKKSIKALEKAMEENLMIFLTAQKDITTNDPAESDLYRIGTISKVKQVLKLPGDNIRVLIEGVSRARILTVTKDKSYMEAEVEKVPEVLALAGDDIRYEAMLRNTLSLFEEYASISPKMPPDFITQVMNERDIGKLSDAIASNLPLVIEDKQKILETFSPYERTEILNVILDREVEVLSLEQEIGMKVRDQMEKNQRDYYLREQIRAIQSELGEGDNILEEVDDYKKKVLALKIPKDDEEKLLKETDRLPKLPFASSEAGVVRSYLDTVLEIPFNVHTRDQIDIKRAEKVLDRDHYGITDVKKRVLEFLAVKKIAPELKGQILCLVGPPGVGKTSIALSIAKAMGRKCARVSLGGIKDESDIRGHRKTYVGAMPGRIINALRQAKSMNPIIVLDEIDKMANDFRGDPASAMLEVLDSEQNYAFRDHFVEIPVDLSEVMFVTTANTLSTIPRPLLDRMEVIELSGYTSEEKKNIAKKHLIPKQLKRHALNKGKLKITDSAVEKLILSYTREAGVRNLEREIASVCRKGAMEIVSLEKKKVVVDEKELNFLLGSEKYTNDELLSENESGIVTGLAWTAVGGEILFVEVNVLEGSGKVELTGQMGDVMKESAKAAVSYIRSRYKQLGIPKDFYKNKDIHIHIPEGAVPKDGPSAGITMATAVISALTGKKVRREVAMTGEITIRGRVLPIGGLKEKTIAAYRAGITTIIIPEKNKNDLEKIDSVVKEHVNFVLVSDIEEVLQTALLEKGKARLEEEEEKNTAPQGEFPIPKNERVPLIKQ